ncbi:MAG: DMT family transporter, partial [Candidatus Micrarchaeota archaeon]|nr:DMT family transporter [Candidatus Micrarchaeota archaeon]
MDERKGILFAAVTALVSGASIFINKAGVAEFDPFLFTALKNALVAVLLLSIILLFSEWKALKRLDARQWKYLAAIGVVGGSIPFLLFFWGLSLTSAVNASFIHKTMFLFIGVLAAVFLREKMEKKYLFAAIALLAGNALLIGLPGSLDYGALLVLAATVFWAVETIISKRALSALEIPPRIVALARMGFGSLVLAAFLFATGRMELLAGLRP